MYILIIIFASASYIIGANSIYQNKYYPSVYTRIIWMLTSLNSTASVILLKNSFSVILLAVIGLIGSLLILILSLKKSKKIFGLIEIISTILLVMSLALWIFTKLPILNLTIGILIIYIGGIPTLIKVIKDPKDENLSLWLFFGIASILSLIGAEKSHISNYLYPLAITIFESVMTLLCLRRFLTFPFSNHKST